MDEMPQIGIEISFHVNNLLKPELKLLTLRFEHSLPKSITPIATQAQARMLA